MRLFPTKVRRYIAIWKDDKYYLLDLESNTLAYFFPSFSWLMKRKVYLIDAKLLYGKLQGKYKWRASVGSLLPIIFAGERFLSSIQPSLTIETTPVAIAGTLLIILVISIGLKIFYIKKDKKTIENIIELNQLEMACLEYNFSFSKSTIKYILYSIVHFSIICFFVSVSISMCFFEPNIISFLCYTTFSYLGMRATAFVRKPKQEDALQIIKTEKITQ